MVDQAALVELLQSGAIGGAGLDFYVDEQRVPDARVGLDNVVLLPHVGSALEATRAAMAELLLANVEQFPRDGTTFTPVEA